MNADEAPQVAWASFVAELDRLLSRRGFLSVDPASNAQLCPNPGVDQSSKTALVEPVAASLDERSGPAFVRLRKDNAKALELLVFRSVEQSRPEEMADAVASVYERVKIAVENDPKLRDIDLFYTAYVVQGWKPSREERKAYRRFEAFYQQKIGFRQRFAAGGAIRLGWYPSIVLIDLNTGKVYGRQFSDVDGIVHRAARAASLGPELEDEASGGVVSELLLSRLKELVILWKHVVFLTRAPDLLARRISSGEVNARSLTVAFVTSVALSAGIEKWFGRSEFEPTGLFLVDELLLSALILALWAVSTTLIHLPLKLMGGKGTFQQSFYAMVFLNVVAWPVLTLLFNVASFFSVPESNLNTLPNAFLYMTFPVLSALHRIGHWRTVWAITLFQLLAVVVLVVIVAIVASLFAG